MNVELIFGLKSFRTAAPLFRQTANQGSTAAVHQAGLAFNTKNICWERRDFKYAQRTFFFFFQNSDLQLRKLQFRMVLWWPRSPRTHPGSGCTYSASTVSIFHAHMRPRLTSLYFSYSNASLYKHTILVFNHLVNQISAVRETKKISLQIYAIFLSNPYRDYIVYIIIKNGYRHKKTQHIERGNQQ